MSKEINLDEVCAKIGCTREELRQMMESDAHVWDNLSNNVDENRHIFNLISEEDNC